MLQKLLLQKEISKLKKNLRRGLSDNEVKIALNALRTANQVLESLRAKSSD